VIQFLYHDGIKREISVLKKKYRTIEKGISIFERLCEVQFNPEDPKSVIAPAKLHRITQNDIWTLWKAELVVPNSGLRPNQWPRIWFVVKGAIVVFLCISSHIENYDNKEMEEIALSRVSDIF
jgi:hypothetical protein